MAGARTRARERMAQLAIALAVGAAIGCSSSAPQTPAEGAQPAAPTIAATPTNPPATALAEPVNPATSRPHLDSRRLELAYLAATDLRGEYQRPIYDLMDDPSPRIRRIPVGPGCEFSSADFSASLRFVDYFGDEDQPTVDIGVTVIMFDTAEQAAAFDVAAANGWETCWVPNSRDHPSVDFVPYEQRADLTADNSVVAGRFSETNQYDDGLVGNYQLVNGRVYGHLAVWTPASVTDPEPDRARMLDAFVQLVDQAAS